MQILASDMDGTIVFHGKIKKKDLYSIHQFQKEGNLFGVCTGRLLVGAISPYPDFHPDFYIASSGACILDANQNILFERTIPYEIGKEIFDTYKHHDWMLIQTGNRNLIYKTAHQIFEELPEYIMESYDAVKEETVHGLSIVVKTEKQAKSIAKELEIRYPMLSAFVNKNSIDIVCKGCSKGIGTQFMQSLYPEATIAGIGDSYNDLPMLEAVQESFTFKDSPKDIQTKVKYTVKSVAEAIEILRKNAL